jgi:hypothetical protein
MLGFKHSLRNNAIDQINEAVALNQSELQKLNGTTGEARIDILRRLIRDGKSLELRKGGNTIVTDIEDALQKLNQFETTPSNISFVCGDVMIPLSQLKKSKVFGGGTSGAGSGTKDTARNECHQAVMCQAMLDHGQQALEFFTPEVLSESFTRTELDTSLKTILETPDAWVLSSYNIAKMLIKEGYIHKGMTFHRGDAKMIKIYALKTQAYRNNGFKPLKDDKWNPGDFWALANDFDIDKELPITSVGAINQAILKHFNDKRLVGISLKGPMTKYPVALKEYNNEYPPDTDNHRLRKVSLESKSGNFWSTKGSFIEYDTGSMNLKDNASGESVKAEIKGTKARGGGIAWGGMKEFIFRETRKRIPDHAKGIKKTAKNIANGNKRSIKLFYIMFKHFYPDVLDAEFYEELNKKDWYWISAKLGSLYVCYHIDTNTGTKANAIITNFVNYAGSKTLDSSTYVKLGK